MNHPGQKRYVDAAKYRAAKAAFLKVLPKSEPGLTQNEMMNVVHKALPAGELRDKSGWWTKTVQLDLEAKGVVLRDAALAPRVASRKCNESSCDVTFGRVRAPAPTVNVQLRSHSCDSLPQKKPSLPSF